MRRFVAVAGVAMALGCGSDGGSEPTPRQLDDLVTSMVAQGVDVDAVFHEGEAPAAGAGPTVTADVQSAGIPGGSVQVSLSSGTAFQRVVLAAPNGAPGWWELTLPAGVTAADIILGLGTELASDSLEALFAVGAAGGAVGAYEEAPIDVEVVGTGEVQVSISWDSPTDVDLHVVDPDGDEIYYGSRTTDEGGELDLDSNAGCSMDEKRNENITWPEGSAKRGTYIVRVDYWSACSFTGTTNYVVTVRRDGHAPQTYTGTLTGAGTNGGEGDGIQVTTFNW